jgi:HSP20 family protein
VARRRDIDRLQGEIEELFSDLWRVPRYSGLRAGFRPLVDCFRTENPPSLTIVVELAGADPDALRIDVGERELVVSGERRLPREPGVVYQQMEIEYGVFERRVALREPVDAEAAAAEYRAGLLTITLPLAPRRPTGERVTIAVRRDGES